jgi:hypothetical protein
MTSSDDDNWETAKSLPTRPLLAEELTEIESQYGAETTTWIEINVRDTKIDLGLGEVGEKIIINFVIVKEGSRYQYRFDGEQWMMKGPFSGEFGPEIWISEAGSLWMTRENLIKRSRASKLTNDTNESNAGIGRSGPEWETFDSLPPHLATPSDLLDLKDRFERAYGTDVIVWVNTKSRDFCRNTVDIEEMDGELVRCFIVETVDVYYRFEFRTLDQGWRKKGPVRKHEYEYEPQSVSKFSILGQIVVDDDQNGQYHWDFLTNSTDRKIVHQTSLSEFC